MIDADEWSEMRSMRQEGMSISEIARRMGHDRKTVSKYVKGDAGPPRYKARAGRPGKLDPYREHIRKMVEEHDWSAVRLLEDVRGMGYEGGYTLVREYARTVRGERTTRSG